DLPRARLGARVHNRAGEELGPVRPQLAECFWARSVRPPRQDPNRDPVPDLPVRPPALQYLPSRLPETGARPRGTRSEQQNPRSSRGEHTTRGPPGPAPAAAAADNPCPGRPPPPPPWAFHPPPRRGGRPQTRTTPRSSARPATGGPTTPPRSRPPSTQHTPPGAGPSASQRARTARGR